MGLVSYSSSSDDEKEDQAPPSKRRRLSTDESNNPSLPPLPQSFRDLYSSSVRLSARDDPSLHSGRKRIVPHVPGNWAAHVYLEYHPSATSSELLTSIINETRSSYPVPESVTSLLTSPLGVVLPLHISLSAPLVLRTENKDAFREAMTDALGAVARKVPALIVAPTRLAWFRNEEGTRAFLVLSVREEKGSLNRLLEASNGVAERFGCRALYAGAGKDGEGDAEGAFHISLAWSLNADELLGDACCFDKESKLTALVERAKELRIDFSEVKLRLGNEVSSEPLGHARQSNRGILG